MDTIILNSEIARDTLEGLSASPKYLLSKYFYDEKGSKIFQDIMKMPEYYLTNCESAIFSKQKTEITKRFLNENSPFDLIELGSGDGFKTKILLRHMQSQNYDFNFIPIDINAEITNDLVNELRAEMPNLKVEPKTGDYFHVLKELNDLTHKRKVILFLGANIGNYSESEADAFINHIADFTNPDDKLLIGLDLKKSPNIIIDAYDDPHGHTRDFNLNLLTRLNRELDANFDTDQFVQHTTYNPQTGDVKSFLISKSNQEVSIKSIGKNFHFRQWEPIFMERSKKYDMQTIEKLASANGFKVEQNYTDSNNYFVDSLWVRM